MIELIFGLSPLLLIVFIFFYYLNLHKALSQSPPESWPINPWLVWLGLLPFVGILWNVVTSTLVSRHIRRRCIDYHIKCYGHLLLFLGVVASFFIGSATLPLIGPGIALIGAPVWILFWIVVARYQRLLGLYQEYHQTNPALATPAIQDLSLPGERNVGELIRINLFRLSLLLLAAFVAIYFVNDFRLSIWLKSGLWVEPTARIQALESERAFYRNAIFCLFPVVLGCWIWASENKYLILYLRKFRQDDINRTMQHAIRKTIFRQFRLLTLDDATFHPITSHRGTRVAAMVVVITACAAILATFGAVRTYLQDGLTGFAQAENLFKMSAMQVLLFPIIAPDMVMEILAQLITEPVNQLVELYRSELEVPMFFVAGFSTLYFGLGIFMAVLAAFYTIALVRLRLLSRLRVRNSIALERFVKYARRIKNWMYSPTIVAPPAAVVTVEGTIWQEAVLSLAATADIILFDLSDHTENLEWEIEQMLALHREKCVFIAQAERFREWTANLSENKTSQQITFVQSLKMVNPITYEKPENLDLLQLTGALKSCLASQHGKRK